jgi:pilus assembly protein CpaE
MSDSKLLVGVVSSSAEARAQLRRQLEATRFACEVLEINHCSTDKSVLHSLIAAKPKIIILDIQAQEMAMAALRHLREALPETCFYVSAASKDPKLILEAMRAGAREFLIRPLDVSRITLALERYSAEGQKIAAKRVNGKIYCAISAKGGVGTTSVAVNLAVATAAASNSKVALVDLGNPVGNIADCLDISPKFSIADAFASHAQLDSALLESYMSHAHGMSILPASKDFSPDKQLGKTLSKLFQILTETYAHTYIDVACSRNQEYLEALVKYSSAILIILTPELPVLRGTDQLIHLFDKIGGSHKLRLVVNRGRKRPLAGAIEIEQDLGHSLYWYLPDDYPIAAKAVNSRMPLAAANHSSLSASYFELARMLTGLQLPKKKRRLFRFS